MSSGKDTRINHSANNQTHSSPPCTHPSRPRYIRDTFLPRNSITFAHQSLLRTHVDFFDAFLVLIVIVTPPISCL